MANCVVCNKTLKVGEYIQAFLRCPNDPEGSWTEPVLIDEGYPERSKRNNDNVKRKHHNCGV